MIVLLCARSFSGKSTLAEALARQLPATVVSLDAINAERGLHGGQGIPIDEWSRTNEVARDRTRGGIADGVTVVVDDTSSPRFLRDGWRALADSRVCPWCSYTSTRRLRCRWNGIAPTAITRWVTTSMMP